ncbi:MAG: acyl-CoA dehydrogenase family protein [Actinomycetota bacterium]
MSTPRPDDALVVAAMADVDHPIKVAAADWARATLGVEDMRDRDRDSVFFREAWAACAAYGLQASIVPTEDGGAGDDIVTTMLKLEGLGVGCMDNGVGFALASQMLSFQDAIIRFGSTEQKAAILPGVCDGSLIGAFAITEPGSGSDTYSMEATAVKDGDHYVLHGHKAHITLGPVADVMVVFAKTNPDAGAWGISAFLVHGGRPGVTQTENHEKMGLRTVPFGDIVLDGYRASEADRLGPEGAGVSIFAACMESERGLIFATQLGAVERVIDDAVERANTRRQFDQPIGAFQAVSHRLAEMRVRHETARLMLYRAAAVIGDGKRATMAAAMSKLVASEAIAAIALDAARVHGARGYVVEYEVEREVRDALGGLVYSGTSDIQRNLIARLMGVSS